MAGLVLDGANPDVSLLDDVNGVAQHVPSWFDRGVSVAGQYGILCALVLVVFWSWWSVRRRGGAADSVGAVAGLLWAPLAAGVALLVNIPIQSFVGRPRPAVDHRQVHVLVSGGSDFSFVSDHATLAMALAAGVFVVHRRSGLVALGLAVLEGACRVFAGVSYPTDVVGGFALGTAVALLLAPLALAALTPLVSAVARSRAGLLVRSRTAERAAVALAREGVPGPRTHTLDIPDPRHDDSNLAA
jgi:undecaprenyl-diphosphatase